MKPAITVLLALLLANVLVTPVAGQDPPDPVMDEAEGVAAAASEIAPGAVETLDNLEGPYWSLDSKWQTTWNASYDGKPGESVQVIAREEERGQNPGKATFSLFMNGHQANFSQLAELSQAIFVPATAECTAMNNPRVVVKLQDAVGNPIAESIFLNPLAIPCNQHDVWQTIEFLSPMRVGDYSPQETSKADLHAGLEGDYPGYSIDKFWFQFDALHKGGIQLDDMTVTSTAAGGGTYVFAEQTDQACFTAYEACAELRDARAMLPVEAADPVIDGIRDDAYFLARQDTAPETPGDFDLDIYMACGSEDTFFFMESPDISLDQGRMFFDVFPDNNHESPFELFYVETIHGEPGVYDSGRVAKVGDAFQQQVLEFSISNDAIGGAAWNYYIMGDSTMAHQTGWGTRHVGDMDNHFTNPCANEAQGLAQAIVYEYAQNPAHAVGYSGAFTPAVTAAITGHPLDDGLFSVTVAGVLYDDAFVNDGANAWLSLDHVGTIQPGATCSMDFYGDELANAYNATTMTLDLIFAGCDEPRGDVPNWMHLSIDGGDYADSSTHLTASGPGMVPVNPTPAFMEVETAMAVLSCFAELVMMAEPPSICVDTDADGELDLLDEDDDNDGRTDEEEALDGTDSKNPDTDSDGWTDGEEDTYSTNPRDDQSHPLDTDDDGTPDSDDSDDDNDGQTDADEVTCGSDPLNASSMSADNDSDDSPDCVDSDDDNDTVPDTTDAFPFDSTESVDSDNDGTGDNADTDDDNDGWSDADEGTYNTNPHDDSDYPLDTDGDGTPDSADSDDDGDGWSDGEEARLRTSPTDASDYPADLDGDGVADSEDNNRDGDAADNADDAFPDDATETRDTDSDGVGNNADHDDDGDGWSDADETRIGTDPLDDQEYPADTDGDGVSDSEDSDIDGDRALNDDDAFPYDDSEAVDTDNDGVGNNEDADDDGDGQTDADEVTCGSDPLNASSMSDDFDADGSPDCVDADDDDDGVADTDDAFPFNAQATTDTDNDGIDDRTDADDDGDNQSDSDEVACGSDPLVASSKSTDNDGDDSPDCVDSDDDNDGVADETDAFPLDANESVDTDNDGTGNNADTDDDDDGQTDADETACGSDPLVADSLSADLDADGSPDCVDSDVDGDGILDESDNCPTTSNGNQTDTDGDGTGDACDGNATDGPTADPDGDGLTNAEEAAFGSDASLADADGDGMNDSEEREAGTNPNLADTDGDGHSDGFEVSKGTDPTNPSSVPQDADENGLMDSWEITHFGATGQDPTADPDGDALTNQVEHDARTNPNLADSDHDGLDDGDEVARGTSPLMADTDSDGLTDASEVTNGTSPLLADTDGDGYEDGYEAMRGTSATDGDIVPGPLAIVAPTVKSTDAGLKLEWTRVEGAVKYSIFRSSSPYVKIGESVDPNFVDDTVVDGQVVKYRVIAQDAQTLNHAPQDIVGFDSALETSYHEVNLGADAGGVHDGDDASPGDAHTHSKSPSYASQGDSKAPSSTSPAAIIAAMIVMALGALVGGVLLGRRLRT